MRHLLREAALRRLLHQLRCAATGAAPQHTLRVGQQLRRHARFAARVSRSARRARARDAPRRAAQLPAAGTIVSILRGTAHIFPIPARLPVQRLADGPTFTTDRQSSSYSRESRSFASATGPGAGGPRSRTAGPFPCSLIPPFGDSSISPANILAIFVSARLGPTSELHSPTHPPRQPCAHPLVASGGPLHGRRARNLLARSHAHATATACRPESPARDAPRLRGAVRSLRPSLRPAPPCPRRLLTRAASRLAGSLSPVPSPRASWSAPRRPPASAPSAWRLSARLATPWPVPTSCGARTARCRCP